MLQPQRVVCGQCDQAFLIVPPRAPRRHAGSPFRRGRVGALLGAVAFGTGGAALSAGLAGLLRRSGFAGGRAGASAGVGLPGGRRRRMPVGDVHILGRDELGIPIVRAVRVGPNGLRARCPFCGELHCHGTAGQPPGKAGGHRVSHCRNVRTPGYTLREASPEEESDA